MMRLRAENERVEKQHKVAMLKAEIARSRMEIKAKQVATAELMSCAKQVVAPELLFQTPQISGLSSARASDFTQGPSSSFRQHDAFNLAGTPAINWAVFNKFSATGACKPLNSDETSDFGELKHVTSVAETISSLVGDCVPEGLLNKPIPTECLILHNVAMASHSTERREIKDWKSQIWADLQRMPTFNELLQFLREQVNGRKTNLSETWIEVFKLQIRKPTSSGEATAAVTSFISRAEKLGLRTSDHELVLSSLILSKLQNCISTEGFRRITDTISNFHSKTATESQLAAVGKAGIFVFLSREVAQSVKTESPPVFMAGVSETATAGQGPAKRRLNANSDAKKSKVMSSALPPAKVASSSRSAPTPPTVRACWSFLAQGTCKKGETCKFSHDAKVLAASRKQQVSNSVTIDYGLLAHCGGSVFIL
jgi:hypothetical protein